MGKVMKRLAMCSKKGEVQAALRPVYATLKSEGQWIDCPRCSGGAGYISAFKHVKGGVCFKCGGCGVKAGNLAAKRANKLNRLFASLSYALRLNGTVDVHTAPKQMYDLAEFVETLPSRYFPEQ